MPFTSIVNAPTVDIPVTLRESASSSPLTSTPSVFVANLYVELPSKYNSTALLSLIITPFSPVAACSSRLPAVDTISFTKSLFELGLYFKPASTLIGLLPLFEPTKVTN